MPLSDSLSRRFRHIFHKNPVSDGQIIDQVHRYLDYTDRIGQFGAFLRRHTSCGLYIFNITSAARMTVSAIHCNLRSCSLNKHTPASVTTRMVATL